MQGVLSLTGRKIPLFSGAFALTIGTTVPYSNKRKRGNPRQRRKAAEKSSAVKEHCTSLPVLQNNQLGTWSELGGSIDLLSSHSTVTRLQKREHTIRSDGNGRSRVSR